MVFCYQSNALQPVLVDFGKSEYVSSSRKFTLTDAKKVEYHQNHKHIAPDLVDGFAKPSPASDIFSFGRLFKNVICYFPLNVSEIHASVKDIVKLCLKYNYVERPTCIAVIEVLSSCNTCTQ